MIPAPPHPRSVPVDRVRQLTAGLLAAGLLMLVLIAPAPARAQEPDTPIETAPSTVITDADESGAVDRDAVDAENRRMMVIVGGLIGIAIALLLLTIRYWRVTRPVAEAIGTEPTDDEDVPRHGPRSRQSVAGADHAGTDDDWQPRTTGEHTIVPDADATARARPPRGVRDTLLDGES